MMVDASGIKQHAIVCEKMMVSKVALASLSKNGIARMHSTASGIDGPRIVAINGGEIFVEVTARNRNGEAQKNQDSLLTSNKFHKRIFILIR